MRRRNATKNTKFRSVIDADLEDITCGVFLIKILFQICARLSLLPHGDSSYRDPMKNLPVLLGYS